MKKIFLFTLVVAFAWAFNADGADLKIGYVDFNKALNESDVGMKAVKKVEDIANSKKTIIKGKETEMDKLREELEKQVAVLTPESKKEKEDQLNKLYREYQRMLKDFNEEIQKKQADLSKEIQKALLDVIQEIGKEEGYSVVFEKGVSGILFSKDEYDVTDKVVKKYNEMTKAKK
ncbi:MAG: OmpH family outer membrane protein [Candidatus Mariimomonas ferrooxydans]